MERVNAGEVDLRYISRGQYSLTGVFLFKLELKMKFSWWRSLKEKFYRGCLILWILSGILEGTHASDVSGDEVKKILSHNFVESTNSGIKLSGYVDMG